MEQVQDQQLQLPIGIISPMDIARMLREVEMLDEFFRQAAIRQGGTPVAIPRYSRLLDDLVVNNKLNLLQNVDRDKIIAFLHTMEKNAPVLHISFSTDPPGPYVQKIVAWLRTNINPHILVRVGLQPNIGAGCVVRTQNHSIDMSLRRFFESKSEFFAHKLHEAVKPTAVDEPLPDIVPAAELSSPPASAPEPRKVPVA